jgi:hypothetical protein
MKVLKIEDIEDYPNVCMDKENNIMRIEGKSLPEDAIDFFSPIVAWIDEYSKDPNEKSVLELKVYYFNTASSKMILYMLEKFVLIAKEGHDVEIHWYYHEDDEDMLEAGEIYAERINFDIKLISI